MTGPLHVGVTGTRKIPPGPQLRAVADVVGHLRPDVLHHGDCQGADEACAAIARSAGARIVGHPPVRNDYRAFYHSDEEREPKGYWQRNRGIVDETTVLIACPELMYLKPARWSGTSYTVAYALSRLRYIPFFVCWPDGSIDYPRIGAGKITFSGR